MLSRHKNHAINRSTPNPNPLVIRYSGIRRRITSDEYDKRVAVCKQQEATFLEELKGHSEADEAFVLSCSYILELAKRAKELFERSQPAQKNQLLRFVLANARVDGEKLVWDLRSPFSGIAQCVKTKEWLDVVQAVRINYDLVADAVRTSV